MMEIILSWFSDGIIDAGKNNDIGENLVDLLPEKLTLMILKR